MTDPSYIEGLTRPYADDPAPTEPTRDLEALRKIAEAATPGPWVKRDSATGFSVYVKSGAKYLAESSWSANSEIYPTIFDAHANFAHIAAFDPPTVLRLIELAREAEHLRRFCNQAAKASGDHEFVCSETVPLRAEIAAITAERDTLRTKLQTACEALGWYTCECSGRCDIAEWRPANSASCIHARTRAVLAAIKKETQPCA